MILDTLENANLYTGVHPLFGQAFDFIRRALDENLPCGRYELAGDALYAMVQAYPIDEENPNVDSITAISIFNISPKAVNIWAGMTARTRRPMLPINRKRTLPCTAQTAADFDVKAGCYAIFFPSDLHKPKMLAGKQ